MSEADIIRLADLVMKAATAAANGETGRAAVEIGRIVEVLRPFVPAPVEDTPKG